jgi:hypothetical protein
MQISHLSIFCCKQPAATPVAGIGPVCAVTVGTGAVVIANVTGCHSKLLQQQIASSVFLPTGPKFPDIDQTWTLEQAISHLFLMIKHIFEAFF